jgi:hypothetical protein
VTCETRRERKFSLESRKILLSKNLTAGVFHQVSQIIERLRLTRKILRSNDLASARRGRPSLLGVRMMGYFGCGAQGQMSQRRRCRLWKSVGWPPVEAFPMLMIFRESDGVLSATVPAVACRFRPPARAFGRAELFSVFFLCAALERAGLPRRRRGRDFPVFPTRRETWGTRREPAGHLREFD